jgi:repressor LexA
MREHNKEMTIFQRRVYDFIRIRMETEFCPPTRVEIARNFGWRSPNAAEDHLRALEKKGVIRLLPHTSRGIQLIDLPVLQPPVSQ